MPIDIFMINSSSIMSDLVSLSKSQAEVCLGSLLLMAEIDEEKTGI